jgi:REP element-mobilizing transposase RayT
MERCENSTESVHSRYMDHPLAFLITFSCYGSHLHGSEGGSVDRNHNVLGGPRVAPEPGLLRARARRMAEPIYALNNARRRIVLAAIRQVCLHRKWLLIAAHVRMTHVHVVVSADVVPEIPMQAFKAYASRLLNVQESGRINRWTRHGSTRYLWKTEDVAGAARYVVDGQGEPMAVFPNTAP